LYLAVASLVPGVARFCGHKVVFQVIVIKSKIAATPHPALYSHRPVEMSIETQTEAFMDRPPSPLFVPAKSGVDADTQVVVGELFEFDLEA